MLYILLLAKLLYVFHQNEYPNTIFFIYLFVYISDDNLQTNSKVNRKK